MSKPEVDPRIKALKQQAWDLKKAEQLGLAKALDIIAQREGHKNWMRLLDAHKKEEKS